MEISDPITLVSKHPQAMEILKVIAVVMIMMAVMRHQLVQEIREDLSVQYDDLALKKCCKFSAYTIHGWWPEYNKKSWPQFCHPDRYAEFNETVIAPIRPKLMKYWKPCDAWGVKPYDFWQHEWRKHGTCTSDGVMQYFGTTVDIFETALGSQFYGCCPNDAIGDKACMLSFNKTSLAFMGCK